MNTKKKNNILKKKGLKKDLVIPNITLNNVVTAESNKIGHMIDNDLLERVIEKSIPKNTCNTDISNSKLEIVGKDEDNSMNSPSHPDIIVELDDNNNNKESKLKLDDDSDFNSKSFSELGVCEEICIICKEIGWNHPTLIQAQVLPYAFEGKDIIGLAETGSGKTAAFGIPIVQKLLEFPRHKGIFGLVLAPTRELTVQIAHQFQSLGSGIALKVCTIIGGLDMVSQAIEIAKKPHIVVGTPGRIVDHLENTKGFSLSEVRFFVLDEADKLLSMDFEEAIDNIIKVLPRNRNTYLFSATMTNRVSKLQRASLVNPVKISVNSKYDTAKNLVQYVKIISFKYKIPYFVGLIAYLQSYSIIVFTNTCMESKRLALCLHYLGFSSVCLHGKMSQPQRLGAINAFKSGKKKVLITTEVGSRGLDIPHIDIVINYDVPPTTKDYIHRVGRTARAGKSGRAITLVSQYDAEAFLKIEFDLKKKLDVFDQVTDEMWQSLLEKVDEAKRSTENQMKDEAGKIHNYRARNKIK